MEAHSHCRCVVNWSYSNTVWVIIHFKYLLLLGRQVNRLPIRGVLLLPVHDSKPHGARDENIVLVSILTVRRLYLSLVDVVVLVMLLLARSSCLGGNLLLLLNGLKMLQLILLRVLVTIISYISSSLLSTAVLTRDLAFLVVAVEVLYVERAPSLVVAK